MPDTRVLLVSGFRKKLTESEKFAEFVYNMFGKFGPIRQVRLGTTPETRGKMIVVYEYTDGAEKALQELNMSSLGGSVILRIVVYDEVREKKIIQKQKRAREQDAEYRQHFAKEEAAEVNV